LMQGAQLFNKAGNPRMAFMYQQAALSQKAQQSKMAYEAAKTRKEDVLAQEVPAMRHEEQMARIRQQEEAARMRSEDMRLSIEQRREAAKEMADLRREIAKTAAEAKKTAAGEKLTKGQESADREFGKEYASWKAMGGYADVEKQLGQLQQVSTELGKPGNDYTGPAVGLIPGKARAFTNPAAVAAKNKVEEVAQRNLRLVLGAQFTQVEGERLIARAYNEQLSPIENKRRVDALINQIRAAAQAKEDASAYFEENGTLKGWKGKIPTFSDFEAAIEAASKTPTQPTATQAPSGMKLIGKSPDGKNVYQDASGKKWVQ